MDCQSLVSPGREGFRGNGHALEQTWLGFWIGFVRIDCGWGYVDVLGDVSEHEGGGGGGGGEENDVKLPIDRPPSRGRILTAWKVPLLD